MTLSTAVLGKVFELEADMAAGGWDRGCALWGMHADEEDLSDLETRMLTPGYQDIDVPNLLAGLLPAPPCFQALVCGFEAAETDDMDPTVPPVETRVLIASLRNGSFVLIRRQRDGKPKGEILDRFRLMTYEGLQDVGLGLAHRLEAHGSDGGVVVIGGGLGSLLRMLGITPPEED